MTSELVSRPQAPTYAEMIAANREWGANCGPTAIAAATGISLDMVRQAVSGGGQTFRGFMGVRDLQAAMKWLDIGPSLSWSKPSSWPTAPGSALVVMLQWGGPWPPRAAAIYRHCVTYFDGQIYDCNNYPDSEDGWLELAAWERIVVPEMIPKRGDGMWSIAWAGQIAQSKQR